MSARPGTSRAIRRFVVRGGAGLFYDRPPANSVYATVTNPPFTRNVTVRYGQLQNLSSTGLATEAPPALTVWQHDNKLPASVQWNMGVQTMLPFAAALDVSYTGQHSFDTNTGVNINAINLGAGVPAGEPEPRGGNVALVDRPGHLLRVHKRGPRPVLPGVCQRQSAAADRVAHVPLDSGFAEPAFPERAAVWLQRHDRALRQAERRRCACNGTPMDRSRSGMTRAGLTSCLATTNRRRT